jgi:hypothetical protein
MSIFWERLSKVRVMEIDQIMSPDVTLLSRIVQIGNIIELFAIVG